jgi:hypothetical protein
MKDLSGSISTRNADLQTMIAISDLRGWGKKKKVYWNLTITHGRIYELDASPSIQIRWTPSGFLKWVNPGRSGPRRRPDPVVFILWISPFTFHPGPGQPRGSYIHVKASQNRVSSALYAVAVLLLICQLDMCALHSLWGLAIKAYHLYTNMYM